MYWEIHMIFLRFLYIRASLYSFDKSIWSVFKKYTPEVYFLVFYLGFLYLCSQEWFIIWLLVLSLSHFGINKMRRVTFLFFFLSLGYFEQETNCLFLVDLLVTFKTVPSGFGGRRFWYFPFHILWLPPAGCMCWDTCSVWISRALKSSHRTCCCLASLPGHKSDFFFPLQFYCQIASWACWPWQEATIFPWPPFTCVGPLPTPSFIQWF